MRKLILIPNEDGYVLDFANGNLSTGEDLGSMRLRRLLRGTPHLASLTWTAVGLEFDYLRAFWRTATKFGVKPFLIDLPVRRQGPIEHTAMFVPGSFDFSGNTGISYTVSARAYVVPNVAHSAVSY